MTRFLVFFVAVVVVVLICLRIGDAFKPSGAPVEAAASAESPQAVEEILENTTQPIPGFSPVPRVIFETTPDCVGPAAMTAAAALNGASIHSLEWAPFRRPETGWETYLPHIAYEIDSRCSPISPGFAAALAKWQAERKLRPDGVLSAPLFDVMKNSWYGRRSYGGVRANGICPDPPPESSMAVAAPAESFGGKTLLLRPGAMQAHRRMMEAARREAPEIFVERPDMLTIFSAYRSPAHDDERCAREGNCQGITRAQCSPHRTGLAMDIVVGAAPGYTVDSSADPNRLYMSRTRAYRWLVENAHRFGFINYVFEPWHWEWTGEPV